MMYISVSASFQIVTVYIPKASASEQFF